MSETGRRDFHGKANPAIVGSAKCCSDCATSAQNDSFERIGSWFRCYSPRNNTDRCNALTLPNIPLRDRVLNIGFFGSQVFSKIDHLL